MSTLLLCSASGAPGVTTTALGLALTWGRDVLLVDADRTPSQAVLAGYLGGASANDLGLSAVLQAHRERRPLLDALGAASMPLPEPPASGRRPNLDPGPERRFLPGFVHLGSIDVFGVVWREFGLACQAAPFDVIVDAGRIGSRGLPSDLAETVDRIGVVVRTSLVSLAALRLYLGLVLEQVPPARVGLVLVGPGRPYRATEVARQFGVDVIAEIVWDLAGASELHEGVPLSKRWRRQALATSFARAAARVRALGDADRARAGVPVP